MESFLLVWDEGKMCRSLEHVSFFIERPPKMASVKSGCNSPWEQDKPITRFLGQTVSTDTPNDIRYKNADLPAKIAKKYIFVVKKY